MVHSKKVLMARDTTCLFFPPPILLLLSFSFSFHESRCPYEVDSCLGFLHITVIQSGVEIQRIRETFIQLARATQSQGCLQCFQTEIQLGVLNFGEPKSQRTRQGARQGEFFQKSEFTGRSFAALEDWQKVAGQRRIEWVYSANLIFDPACEIIRLREHKCGARVFQDAVRQPTNRSDARFEPKSGNGLWNVHQQAQTTHDVVN